MMNCPNCGAHVEVALSMTDDDLVPSRQHWGGRPVLIARERWTRWYCAGLLRGDGSRGDWLSPPCGWFRWRHQLRDPGDPPLGQP